MGQVSTKSHAYKLVNSISENLSFFGFIQGKDCSMLLTLVLESGWHMKYSVSVEDIIKSSFARHLAKIEKENKARDKLRTASQVEKSRIQLS